MAYFAANRLEDAIESFNRSSFQNKDICIYLAASYALIGETLQAQTLVTELFHYQPDFDPEEVVETHSYLRAESKSRLLGGLRMAISIEKPAGKLRII